MGKMMIPPVSQDQLQNLQLHENSTKVTWTSQAEGTTIMGEARAVVWMKPQSGKLQALYSLFYNIQLKVTQFFCQRDWTLVEGKNQEDIWIERKSITINEQTKNPREEKTKEVFHKSKGLNTEQSKKVDAWLKDKEIDDKIKAVFKEKLPTIPEFDTKWFEVFVRDSKITKINVTTIQTGAQTEITIVYNIAKECFEVLGHPKKGFEDSMIKALGLKNSEFKDKDIPGLIKFRSVTSDDTDLNMAGIIMEYCPGGDLNKLWFINDVPIDPKNRAKDDAKKIYGYMLQVAETLKELAARGFVHHDIKPDNILIAEDGKTRVGDIINLTKKDTIIYATGTLKYKAPEIIGEELGPYVERLPADPSHDAWSFGVMLFQLATGKEVIDEKLEKLIGKDTFSSQLENRLKTEIRKISDQNMKELLKGLLMIDPKNRMAMDAAIPYLEKLAA